MASFLSNDELSQVGFADVGQNVLVSRNASFFSPGSIRIADHVRIDDFCVISGGSELSIDSYTHISAFVALYAGSGICIGKY